MRIHERIRITVKSEVRQLYCERIRLNRKKETSLSHKRQYESRIQKNNARCNCDSIRRR